MNNKEYEVQRSPNSPLIVTPFQIFCFQNRSNVMKMHPNLKGTAITSILAKMWRSMDLKEKQQFEEWSFALRTQKSHNLNDIKYEYFEMNEKSLIQHESYDTFTPLESIVLPYPPKINIRSHSNFGRIASEVSKNSLASII